MLPIAQYREQLLYLIESNAVSIVVASTGSGKTTQIPQFLLQQGWSGIVCTQPRRMTTIASATRVASEVGCTLGREVGYCVRFDDCTSEDTRLRFMTDGMLLRECLHDPLLSRYSVIMIDEAHERSLHSDLLVAVVKKIMKRRPELKVIVSSATIDAEAFARFFRGPKVYGPQREEPDKKVGIISIDAPRFPVKIHFLPGIDYIRDEASVVDATCRLIEEINNTKGAGDVLVFLAGRSEIEACYARLMESSGEAQIMDSIRFFKRKKTTNFSESNEKLTILPLQLFAGFGEEEAVLKTAPPGRRKVILSTNVAEASVTIDGVTFVIDTGRMKIRFWDPNLGYERLCTVPISKASARQRAGRAGRTAPGCVYRLYSQEFYQNSMPRASIPDLHLSNLTPTVLQLKALGIAKIEEFEFLSLPPIGNIRAAEEELLRLGALERFKDSIALALTDPLGKQMAQLPLQPGLAKALLIASSHFKCAKEAAAMTAMMTIQMQNSVDQNCFFNDCHGQVKAANLQRKFWTEEGDHMTLVSVFMSYLRNASVSVRFCQKYHLNLKNLTTAHRLYSTLMAYLKAFKLDANEATLKLVEISVKLRKALIAGFGVNIARADEVQSSYRSITNQNLPNISIHPTSVLFKRLPPLILYSELLETTKIFARFVSVIEEEDWLPEMCPQLYEFKNKRLPGY